MDWEGGVEMSLGPREQEELYTSALKIVVNFELSVTIHQSSPLILLRFVCTSAHQ